MNTSAPEDVEKRSKKRLVHTSQPFSSTIGALDIAEALRQFPGCEYAYVTDDNRVVGIYECDDLEPDQQVMPWQQRILVPNYQ